MRPQPIAINILREKYARAGERTMADVLDRVTRGLAAVEPEPERWEPAFREALRAGFIPAGRILAACGVAGSESTLINCFVQPIGDTLRGRDGEWPGILDALAEAAETLRCGGGVGYDFSPIRPRGALVRGTHRRAAGPVSHLRRFERVCETVASAAGSRRGAQMAVLRCDHPDIIAFIHAKDQTAALTNFNLSVGVTDALMHAVQHDRPWPLLHRAKPAPEQLAAGAHRRDDGLFCYRELPARQLWQQIMRCSYTGSEPGVLFLDRINTENNLAYAEAIAATNPCGEQPMPPYGCCCLGSIDLARLVNASFTAGARFDYNGLARLAMVAVRMLDDVLDVTHWPLPQQAAEAAAKRRIGLGFLGLGDALVMLDLRYDGEPARRLAARIASRLRDAAYQASIALAGERGPFPLLDKERYLAGAFCRRLPPTIRAGIARTGIRNSHLLSIAPTGTISLAFADNASNGIEPPFAWTCCRRKRTAAGREDTYEVEDHAYRLYREAGHDTGVLPEGFVTALELAPLDHVRMVAAVQPYIDSAIAKTVNVPEETPYDAFEGLYAEAWQAGLKGLTTYRPSVVRGAVLMPPIGPRNGAGNICCGSRTTNCG